MSRVNVRISEESTLSRTVKSDLNVGIVMETPRGLVDRPVLVSNEMELLVMFGEPTVNYPVMASIRQYLRSYSGVYISRIGYEDAEDSLATIKNGETPVLIVRGNSHSSYENEQSIELEVKEDGSGRLTITDADGLVRFTVTDLSLDSYENLALDFNARSNQYTMSVAGDLLPNQVVDLVGTTTAKFSGGVTGGTFGETEVQEAIKRFDTVDINRVDILCAPGLNTSESIVETGVEVAESRYETLYLSDFIVGTDTAEAIVQSKLLPHSDRVAVYHPAVLMRVPVTTETTRVMIPASAAVLFTYAKATERSMWSAPASLDPGFGLPNVVRTEFSVSYEEADELYEATNERPAINSIVFDNTIGYYVDGQRTCAPSSNLRHSINIARLANHVWYLVNNASRKYKFKPMTDFTWQAWILEITDALGKIQNGGGITEFQVKMGLDTMTDDDINAGRLKGLIRIQPTAVADYIEIGIGLITELVGTSR